MHTKKTYKIKETPLHPNYPKASPTTGYQENPADMVDSEITGDENQMANPLFTDIPNATNLVENMNATLKMMDATTAIDYQQLRVSSDSFENEGLIPSTHTCDGININPNLRIENIPANTVCLALIVDDPDAPIGNWVHWLVWNMPVTHHIKVNEVHGTEGLNDFQENKYVGPCPPNGTHHYHFKVYALDSLLNLPHDTRKISLEKAMSTHIIGFGELIGLYKRNDNT